MDFGTGITGKAINTWEFPIRDASGLVVTFEKTAVRSVRSLEFIH